MLLGPSQKLNLPSIPNPEEGIQGIIKYLEGLEKTVLNYTASLVTGSIGMIGIRGLSSSGTSAQNFVERVSLDRVATGRWVFDNPEPDTSYMLFFSGSVPASTIITGVERGTTYAIVTCTTGITGLYADILLLR